MVPQVGLALRDAQPWDDLASAVRLAEASGYAAVFVPEVGGREAFSTLAAFAGETTSLRLGTGVVPLDSRSLDVIAAGGATVHERSGGRIILGLGSGGLGVGALAATGSAVLSLRRLFLGEPVVLPGSDTPFQLLLAPGDPPPEIWIAALGPKMVRLAGSVADGVLLNWCTPERVAEAVTLVAEGADASGRDPGEVTVAAYVRACLDPDRGAAASALRRATLGYTTQAAYARQFAQMGFDPQDPDAVAAGVCLMGDPAAARQRLAAYREAGALLPVVYPVPTDDLRSSVRATLLGLAPHPASAG